MLHELPPLQLVRHARAKRLRLKVSADSIRLTVPDGCSRGQVEQFLVQSQDWIMQSWQKQQALRQLQDATLLNEPFSDPLLNSSATSSLKSLLQQSTALRPRQLRLFNRTHVVNVVYQTQRALSVWDAAANTLYVHQDKVIQGLSQFVLAYAQQHLPVYLHELATQTGLDFNVLKIKRPKTRWGSCSSQKNIMLHAALVVLPEHLLRYVCIHELAHTRQMNHSAAFWAVVAHFDAQYMQHRQQLKQTQLPAWCYV